MIDAASLISFRKDGTLDEECTELRFRRIRSRPGPVVIPGFYGADPSGQLHIFPRNGSDITGALAAAGVDAGVYENWTDVPGLMTADPAIVPEARLIPQISYRQMRALARAGARVLHPVCLDPVALAGIPTRLRCTANPSCFGTLIGEHFEKVVPCVVGKRGKGDAPACVSAFGLPEARVREAAAPLHPLNIVSESGAVRVFVQPDGLAAAMRTLHRSLIE